jgi:hypothetical protein
MCKKSSPLRSVLDQYMVNYNIQYIYIWLTACWSWSIHVHVFYFISSRMNACHAVSHACPQKARSCKSQLDIFFPILSFYLFYLYIFSTFIYLPLFIYIYFGCVYWKRSHACVVSKYKSKLNTMKLITPPWAKLASIWVASVELKFFYLLP